MKQRSNLDVAKSVLDKLAQPRQGAPPLYNVGDHVRASHVGSNILEAAVVKEIVEKYIGHKDTTLAGPIVGPLYWIRFDVGGILGLRWQNELVAEPVPEHATTQEQSA